MSAQSAEAFRKAVAMMKILRNSTVGEYENSIIEIGRCNRCTI